MGDRSTRLLWPVLGLPAMVWIALFFLVPLYVVFCVAFGTVDPVFRSPVPTWNPLQWQFDQVEVVWDRLFGPDNFYLPAVLRTFAYIAIAVSACLLISFPVAYFTARFAGKYRGLVLALLIAPFWISYMMRMLAWINLLQPDGLVNAIITLGGTIPLEVNWLSGKPYVVVMGLIYGYVPYMLLPLFAALDRISPSLLEAARDLGASGFDLFRRVILPMSVPGIVAGSMLVALPMMGDYFTSDLLSKSPNTAMIGNLINLSIATPGQSGQAGALLLVVLLVMLVPMVLYTRSNARAEVRS
ncbi:MAG: ABC transporter permease [Actinomycetales bacterium]|nr:ABC transporter permease [Actinomycetales bacterium]